MSKLQGWKEGLLNQAGKEVLIKAVIQAIPTYAKAMIKFPKTFCQSLMVARFWWIAHGKDGGIHWKKWSDISGSKKEGVLISWLNLQWEMLPRSLPYRNAYKKSKRVSVIESFSQRLKYTICTDVDFNTLLKLNNLLLLNDAIKGQDAKGKDNVLVA